jgi:hypothetical protein
MMTNVIEFPSRKFAQWGALAQEMVSSLRSVGATKAQAEVVTERMRAKWDRCDAFPADDGFLPSFPSEASPPLTPADGDHFLSSREMHVMSARTLMKLARSELRRLPVS